MSDPNFTKLNDYDKNIMYWIVLLHDIRKRGSPVVTLRDPIHPFSSA